MSENELAKEFRSKIADQIDWSDLQWFIKLEIKSILNHLNYYRLKNLFINIDSFKEYLESLNQQYNIEVEILLK